MIYNFLLCDSNSGILTQGAVAYLSGNILVHLMDFRFGSDAYLAPEAPVVPEAPMVPVVAMAGHAIRAARPELRVTAGRGGPASLCRRAKAALLH